MTKFFIVIALTVFSLNVFAEGEDTSTANTDSVDERCKTSVVNGDGQESDGSSTPAPAADSNAGQDG